MPIKAVHFRHISFVIKHITLFNLIYIVIYIYQTIPNYIRKLLFIYFRNVRLFSEVFTLVNTSCPIDYPVGIQCWKTQ